MSGRLDLDEVWQYPVLADEHRANILRNNLSIGSSAGSFTASCVADQTGINADGTTLTRIIFGNIDSSFVGNSLFGTFAWGPRIDARVMVGGQVYVTGTFAAGTNITVALCKNGVMYKEFFVSAAKANNAIVPVSLIFQVTASEVIDFRLRGTTTSGTLTVVGHPEWTFISGSVI